jgi:hypothetical protein
MRPPGTIPVKPRLRAAVSKTIIAFLVCVGLSSPFRCIASNEPPASGFRSEEQNLRATLIATSLFLGSMAIVFEIESDRAYTKYLETANPALMQSYYDTAERKRSLSTYSLVAAEASIILLVLSYMREKPEPEPEPGGVLIGLRLSPERAGVEVRW